MKKYLYNKQPCERNEIYLQHFMFLSHFSCFADIQVRQQGKIRLHTPKPNLSLLLEEATHIFFVFLRNRLQEVNDSSTYSNEARKEDVHGFSQTHRLPCSLHQNREVARLVIMIMMTSGAQE